MFTVIFFLYIMYIITELEVLFVFKNVQRIQTRPAKKIMVLQSKSYLYISNLYQNILFPDKLI